RYGWYTAVIMSLLVTAFSLARSIAERMSRTSQGRYDADVPPPAQHSADHQYPGQQYAPHQYPGQPSPAGQHHRPPPPAAWPQEDLAWGRRSEEETPREADEPGRSQP